MDVRNIGGNIDQASAKRNVVWHGDSLTWGENGDAAGTTLAPRLAVVMSALGPNVCGTNFGHSGRTLAEMLVELGACVNGMFDPQVRDNYLVVQGGHNSLATFGGALTPAECILQIRAYATMALATNPWKLVWCTQLPAAYPIGYPENFEELRSVINTYIRSNWRSLGISAVSDVASDTRVGGAGCQYDATYYHRGDCTHLTNAGYSIWGEYDLRAMMSVRDKAPETPQGS